jgi:hypothetical protein
MITMKRTILFFLIASFFVIPTAQALEPVPGWNSTCVDSTTLLKRADIYLNDTLYAFNQTISCNYGCDTGRDICNRWPGDAIPSEYYLLFEIMTLGMFFVVIYRLDVHVDKTRIFDVAIATLMMVMFFILALQGNNVIDATTGEAVQIHLVVWFNYGMGVFSLLPFFLAMFKYIHSEVVK